MGQPSYFTDRIMAVMRDEEGPTEGVGVVMTIARGYVEAERRGILDEAELNGYRAALRTALATDAHLPGGTSRITTTVNAMIDYRRKHLA